MIQPPWSQDHRKTLSGRKNIRRTLHATRKRQWYDILGKSDISKKWGKKRKKHVWLPGRMHISIKERSTLERTTEASVKKAQRQERSKTKQTQHQRNTTSYLRIKRPEDTSSRYLWLVNYGERTSTSPLALGYPLLGPSRHVRAYYCIP